MVLDSSSLRYWELVSEIGFVAVIIGVVLEVVDLSAKWYERYRGRELPRRFHRWILPIETIGFCVLVAGLAVEFLGSHNAMRIGDDLNSQLNAEAGQARKDAGEAIKQAEAANERASTNELQLVQAKSELATAQARLNESMAELQNESVPMDIGEQASFAKALTAAAGVQVLFRCLNDVMAQSTAKAMAFVLGFAKWKVAEIGLVPDAPEEGITIGYGGDKTSGIAADMLERLLIDRGLPINRMDPVFNHHFVGTVPTNTVVVIVGQRPKTAESKYIVARAKRVLAMEEISEIAKELSGKAHDPAESNRIVLHLRESEERFQTLCEQEQEAGRRARSDSTNRAPGIYLHNNVVRP